MTRRLLDLPFAIVIAAVTTVSAQTSIGPRVGLNVASLSSPDFSPYPDPREESSYLAPSFGLVFQRDLSTVIFVRIEPGYTQKGTKYSIKFSGEGGISATTKVDYVTVPVLLGAQVPVGPISPYVIVGPNVGMAFTQGYNAFDFALDAGLGAFVYPSPTISMFAELRTSIGFSNFRATAGSYPTSHTRGVLPSLGMLFLL
jgi:hypothetical protein